MQFKRSIAYLGLLSFPYVFVFFVMSQHQLVYAAYTLPNAFCCCFLTLELCYIIVYSMPECAPQYRVGFSDNGLASFREKEMSLLSTGNCDLA